MRREHHKRSHQKRTPPSHVNVLAGKHAVLSVLKHNPKRCLQIYIQRTAEDREELSSAAKSAGFNPQFIDRQALTDLNNGDAHHQGIVVSCKPFEYADFTTELLESAKTCLILDGVVDPRNLGRAARSALAFGADFLVIPKDRSAQVSAAAEKAAVGAFTLLPTVQVTNIVRTLEQLKDHHFLVVGAAGESKENVWEHDLTDKIALVIGAEEKGIRHLVRKTCDLLVSIPMVLEDMSLNAADAATVILYEIARQRSKSK